ncbi:MAG: hypothetical protein ACI9NC_006038 [Verrucomicrobiales bacterium]
MAQAPAGKRVKTVSVGTDGTCMLMCKDEGWREVMVGTIALYAFHGFTSNLAGLRLMASATA